MYLLDTNIISYLVRGDNNVIEKIKSIPTDQICLSSVTVSELLYGANTHPKKSIELSAYYLRLINEIEILDFDIESAIVFSKIKAKLKKSGNLVEDADIQIASIAISNNMILVTNNTKDFIKMDKLKIENWIKTN